MTRDDYKDLRISGDTGRPLREDIAKLIYSFDAIADASRTHGDYLHAADNILEFIARRAVLDRQDNGFGARKRVGPGR